ncbi:MAG: MFS transporter [Vulcanisaeta sp.]|uniref:MFS transporter n=2 Tax=Vulcanisaeta sp. TaxID=2020871 RepID=UPI003D0F26C4
MVNRFLVFVGVLVPFLMSAFCVFSVVYLFPGIAAEFHVSIKYLSFLVMLSFIGGALGGVVLGMLADAYGRRVGLLVSVLIFSVFTLVAGFVNVLWVLYVFWFLVGFGVNAENGITYAVITEVWKGGRGLMGGLVQGIYFVGILMDAALTSIIPSWRIALFIVGALSLVLSVPLVITIPETTSKVGISRVGYGELFRGKYLLLTVLSTALVASAFLYTIPLVSLAPTYLSVVRVGDLHAWLIALPIIGVIAYILAGYLSDVYGRTEVLLALSTIAAVSAIALLIIPVTSLDYVVIPMAMAYFSSSIFSYLGVFISELYPMRFRATASNFAFLLGRVLGGVGPPLVAILFIKNLSFGLGVVLLICAVVALVSTLIIKRVTRAG